MNDKKITFKQNYTTQVATESFRNVLKLNYFKMSEIK
jgi:hypothetical protein